MKTVFFLLLAVIPAVILTAAEPQAVCDENGICRIVEAPAKSNDTAAPQVVCDENGICRIVDADGKTAEPAADTEAEVRKFIGFAGKETFLQFLKNEAADSTNTAFWGMMLIALLGGLALNLTPCVLPMLPINLAVIGASGGGKGLLRGTLYGCGMAVTYGILGVLAAFAGISFGTLNSSPVFNFAVALIFLLMSLAIAGVVNFDLAGILRIKPGKLKFSGELSALFMGAVSAMLAGACVAPVVVSVLIFAAGSGWYGCLVPFALGLGMALPWPLAGAGLAVLPKPGRFMVVMKYIFAITIFAAAIYYVKTAINLLPSDSITSEIDGFTALKNAEKLSQETGKPVLVKFTASWCKNCREMEKTTLRDPEVDEYIRENFIPVTFPAENPDDPDVADLLAKYEIPGFPAFLIIPPHF